MTERAEPSSPQGEGDQPIVFIVDDDASMRRALTNLFESVGLKVEAFGSAPQLLQAKPPEVPSCLVLDIRLPGASGFELQTDLAKANIHTPIIFLTGHGDIPMTVRAMKSGAIDFLTKPVRDQDILDAVQAAIERDRKRRDFNKTISSVRSRFEFTHLTGAGRVVAGNVGTDEQASGGPARFGGNHCQNLSRPDHAENGCEIAGRPREDERGARDSTQ